VLYAVAWIHIACLLKIQENMLSKLLTIY